MTAFLFFLSSLYTLSWPTEPLTTIPASPAASLCATVRVRVRVRVRYRVKSV
jgi:hypothetical protein